jgi:type IV pilus assembly protein PilQ
VPTAKAPLAAAVLLGAAALFAPSLNAQSSSSPPSRARRVSVTWEQAPIREVLQAFAAFSGVSIVAGADVDGFVTADINDRPWDVALATILASQGLRATENEYGIIRVETLTQAAADEGVEPLLTRTYRLSFSRASELQGTVAPLLSPRGAVAVVESTNSLVVTDIARVHRTVVSLLR